MTRKSSNVRSIPLLGAQSLSLPVEQSSVKARSLSAIDIEPDKEAPKSRTRGKSTSLESEGSELTLTGVNRISQLSAATLTLIPAFDNPSFEGRSGVIQSSQVVAETLTTFRSILIQETDTQTRCIVLSGIAVFIAEILLVNDNVDLLVKTIDTMLAFLRSRDIEVSRCAISLLSHLSSYASEFKRISENILSKILRALSRAICHFVGQLDQSTHADKPLTSLLQCTLEWLLSIPDESKHQLSYEIRQCHESIASCIQGELTDVALRSI